MRIFLVITVLTRRSSPPLPRCRILPPPPIPSEASPHPSDGGWWEMPWILDAWFLSYLWELCDLEQVSSISLTLLFPVFL